MYIFDRTVGRRKFIKDVVWPPRTAAGLGATVYAKEEIRRNPNEPIPSWLLTPRKKHWGREAQMDSSCCNMCGQSGILVHVVDGVVEKIEPNHWNPNNYTNISTDFFDGYRSLWLQGRRLDLPEEGQGGHHAALRSRPGQEAIEADEYRPIAAPTPNGRKSPGIRRWTRSRPR